MNFVYKPFEDDSVLKLSNKGSKLPETSIECNAVVDGKVDTDKVLKCAQDWLDALSLTDVEYKVYVQLH